jgi:hypothetical protein
MLIPIAVSRLPTQPASAVDDANIVAKMVVASSNFFISFLQVLLFSC